jgi:hypothetical protein
VTNFQSDNANFFYSIQTWRQMDWCRGKPEMVRDLARFLGVFWVVLCRRGKRRFSTVPKFSPCLSDRPLSFPYYYHPLVLQEACEDGIDDGEHGQYNNGINPIPAPS